MKTRLLSLALAILAANFSAAAPLKTSPAQATHPLDPLTADEFAVLRDVLVREGGFGAKTIYTWAQLHEPPKAEVLAFKPGEAFRREAFVALLSPERKTACELIVDLKERAILSKRDLGNLQPFLTDPDNDAATEAIDGSAELRAALGKRGFHLDGKKISEVFYLDLYAPGREVHAGPDGRPVEQEYLTPDRKTIRAIRVLLADRQGGRNNYGPYVEGLMAIVDVYEKRVLELFDLPGARSPEKIAADIFDRQVLGPRNAGKMLSAGEPGGGDLTIDGNHVRWGQWDFRYSFNLREGLVLHQIAYRDGERPRSICYRASISEMLVPYADPTQAWAWREFFDSGEYGLGYLSNEVNAGKELPTNATTIDAVLPDTALASSNRFPNRVFLFERDGGALFAHTQYGDRSRVYARAKDLVIGFVVTLGNYDYIYQWVFRQDGSFGFETQLEGLILTKTVADAECGACAKQSADGPGTYLASGAQAFGTLVAPQILGVQHQHWINLRLDFDIDGARNAVKEINTAPWKGDAARNPRGRAFTVATTVFGREQEARRNCNPGTNRSWIVYNPAQRSPLGHSPGYEIHAHGNTASCLPESRWGEETSFTQRHLWVTRYHPDEMYAAGRYPNQARRDYRDDLFHYSEDNENIYQDDVVVWYSLGVTHVTKPEDYPIMAGVNAGVDFLPEGFFERSPATIHATIEMKP